MSARDFLAAGFALVPIPLGQKAPNAQGWQLERNAVRGEENAARVSGNAGLLHAWSRTCAIDIDDYDAAEAWFDQRGVSLERLFLADDAVSVSSGKPNRAKLLYRLPDGTRPLPSRKLSAADGRVVLEFRCASSSGESMQDVVAGRHPDGGEYTVTGEPANMPVLPEAILRLWGAAERKAPPEDLPAGAIPQGARDDTLFRLARKLHNAGAGAAAVYAALVVENKRCVPPLDDTDLRRIARSASTLGDRPDWKPPRLGSMLDTDGLIAEARKVYVDGGLKRGDLPGWPSLNELYSVLPGQWTLVTGTPQSGKSEWLDAMLVNLAEADPSWGFAIYSPEKWPPFTHLTQLVEKRVRKPYNLGPTPRMTLEEFDEGAAWVKRHFFWVAPELKTPTQLIECGLENRGSFGKFGVVLDPWNALDHERGGLSETDYISNTLTRVIRLARESMCHVWLVAHPQKPPPGVVVNEHIPGPYSISGSAHWYNKGDSIITVYRNRLLDTQDVEIHVQKIRFRHAGKVGMAVLKWDKVTGRYFEFRGVAGERYMDPEANYAARRG